ncbi:MAG: acyl-CoA dehydrogenase family protein [Pseudomonadota bacterium]
MDMNYSQEELDFRDEVRGFLEEKLPAKISAKVKSGAHPSKEDYETWHSLLNDKGWLAIGWSPEYGGTGWSPVFANIFDEECCLAGAPRVMPFGLNMLGPVLIKFGTEAQRARFLPRILDGTDWWCQGYSEPGAGSDLASLKTQAVLKGDHYVVNGQKTWTTLGQHANWIFCLVRTDSSGKPQTGISFLLIDMDTPGVTVRPIITLDGAHEVNEVFFDDVEVPLENLVGEENQGWTVAKYLLTHERTNLAGVGIAASALNNLKQLASKKQKDGSCLLDDPLFAARVAKAEIDLMALRITNLRAIDRVMRGGSSSVESSMLKLKGTQVRQGIFDLCRRALGPQAAADRRDLEENENQLETNVTANYLNNLKLSIFGGSNEIQRNIIAKLIIGV